MCKRKQFDFGKAIATMENNNNSSVQWDILNIAKKCLHMDKEMAVNSILSAENGRPVRYEAESFFLLSLLKPDLVDDIPAIYAAFKSNAQYSPKEVTAYKNISRLPLTDYQTEAYKMLGIMYNAVKDGNVYSGKLFIEIYKAYFRSEYKVLKRFKKIDLEALLTLTTDTDVGFNGNLSEEAAEDEKNIAMITDMIMARICFMGELLGVELENEIEFLFKNIKYNVIQYEKIKKEDADSKEKAKDKNLKNYREYCEKELKQLQQGTDPEYGHDDFFTVQAYADFNKQCLFPDYSLKGFAPELDPEEINELVMQAILNNRRNKANRCYDLANMEHMAFVEHMVREQVRLCKMYEEMNNVALGLSKPELQNKFMVIPKIEVVKEKKVKADNSVAVAESYIQKERQLNDEIERLKAQLSQMETKLDKQTRRADYLEGKLEEAECENTFLSERLGEYEIRNEISADEDKILQDENIPEDDETGYDEMVESLKQKKVVIIGGHPNWKKKLKSMFPDWMYIIAEAGGSLVKLPDDTDMVYFFNEHLCHPTFNTHIKLIREKNIPYDYLRTINIEQNVRQFYNDLFLKKTA